MRKTFLLDTGILLSTPQALFSFDEHDVLLTYDSIRELNQATKLPGETGANAREALRLIAEYAQADWPSDGGLHILPEEKYRTLSGESPVIKAYQYAKEAHPNVTLVSNNSMTKIQAQMNNVRLEPYTTERVIPLTEQYKGRRNVYISEADITALYHEGILLPDDDTFFNLEEPLVENEYLILHNASNPDKTALGIYQKGRVHALSDDLHPYGITPRKVGQRFALHALLAPVEEIPLVILKGPAGTAKTFLSLAAGLEQTINHTAYDRILVTRPNIKFDHDIGYLKGTEEEKIGPLIRPVMDNLELLCRTSGPSHKDGAATNNYVQDLFAQGTIVAQAMAYMRGRSIANTYILVDEVQNCSPLQVFGLISRIGAGSKVILAGDPAQIDNPELDTRNNGLSYASEKMRGSSVCAQVTFEPEECVRSELALEAIQRMSGKSMI